MLYAVKDKFCCTFEIIEYLIDQCSCIIILFKVKQIYRMCMYTQLLINGDNFFNECSGVVGGAVESMSSCSLFRYVLGD